MRLYSLKFARLDVIALEVGVIVNLVAIWRAKTLRTPLLCW